MNYDFIAVPKVINHKLGLNAAAVLGVLIYKYKYWNDQGKLTVRGNSKWFHISHSDIEEEICLGTGAITKAIKRLKKERLIATQRQGLNKPNLYNIDEDMIDEYIEDHKQEYENWRHKLRVKNTSKTPVNSWIGLNEGSRTAKSNDLDPSKSTTTKNKSTKNKQLRITTNRINAEEEAYDQLDDLTEAIIDLRESDDNEESHLKLFLLLRGLVPRFEKFSESPDDSKLIDKIKGYSLDSGEIAFKIVKNAISIIQSKKDPRFGNLFVGLDQINENWERRI